MKHEKLVIKLDEGLIRCPKCRNRLNDIFHLWKCPNCSSNLHELIRLWLKQQEVKKE